MPEFKPFPGIRYDTATHDIAAVTAPPYDVIDGRGRAELLARDPHNVVRVDLPDEADGPDRYAEAARTFATWLDDGVLVRDAEPTFTVYRMDYTDDAGRPAHTLGVLGALRLTRPDEGEILPHEHTTPKAKTDRLDLLRATRVNLSAIWGLSLTEGLTEACTIDAPADETWTDPDGVTHSVWVVADQERCARISALVAATPIVVADGHHRYETSVAYRDERRATGDAPEGAEAAMVYVVELTETELTVRPIHRLVEGVDDTALAARLDEFFTRSPAEKLDDAIVPRMVAEGALVHIAPDGAGTFLTPRPGAFETTEDLDSSRLAEALAGLPDAQVVYQHGVDNIVRAVGGGEATHGFLLRPATVGQIRENAHAGRRMPPKTTFFHPKPRTGPVFRSTD